MKALTKIPRVKALCICAVVLVGISVTGCPGGEPVTTAGQATEAIGVYDSRAVAVAYAGSDLHESKLTELKAEYDAAKAAGNAVRVLELEADAKAEQSEMHRQGFGIAPVDDILAQIKEELQRIQADAGVVALVSKWDDATLAKHPGAGRVDVTMALVDAFHPNDRQRESALEIQKHKPIPRDELEKHIEDGDI
jgi:hypothetical protein